MYAVVKAGGKQHKVAIGDVVEVNRLEGEAGDAVTLPALLLVDGPTVTSEASALAKIAVTGEIVGHHKGPKIKILKYKNKTGYRRRIGHRQLLTELLVTDIDDGKPKKKKKKVEAEATKAAGEEEPSKAAKDTAKLATAEPDAEEKPSKTANTANTANTAKTTKTAAKATGTAKTTEAPATTDEKED